MSIEVFQSLAAACETWMRGCDENEDLARATTLLEGVLEGSRKRRRAVDGGAYDVFEGLLARCEQWLREENLDEVQAEHWRRLVWERFRMGIIDDVGLETRLGECRDWMFRGDDLQHMGIVLERLGYWFEELGQEFERRQAEEERAWTPPERGTYREPPIVHAPSWGPSEPVAPPYDEENEGESFIPPLPDDPDDMDDEEH